MLLQREQVPKITFSSYIYKVLHWIWHSGYFPHTAELAVINTITNELDMNMNELQQAMSTDLKVDLKDLSLGVKKANRLWQKRFL